MAVRMKDIATDLNLSTMTISKVLRGQTDVSESTKARVLQRVKELNYRPNLSAGSLRTGKTLRIGLVVPLIADPFFTDFAGRTSQDLFAAGYGVSLSTSDQNPEVERSVIDQHLSWRVDGLILASVQSAAELKLFAVSQQTPFVFVSAGAYASGSNSVLVREEQIGSLAAEHLLDRGCREIANVRGPRSLSTDLRFNGFRSAVTAAGFRIRPELVADVDGMNLGEYQRGFAAADRLLRARPRPDGIVCHSDLLGVGVMDRVLAEGLRIPRDIRIMGCGNVAPVCDMRISLTSIDLSAAEVGRRAATMVLKLIGEGPGSTARNVSVSPRLVLRDSTCG